MLEGADRASGTPRCWPGWPAARLKAKHDRLGKRDREVRRPPRRADPDAAGPDRRPDRPDRQSSPPGSRSCSPRSPPPRASTPTAPPARPPGGARAPRCCPPWTASMEVTGIGRGGALVILAEIGLDMTRFPRPAHLVSWAKLSPRTIQSGARSRAGRTGKGNPYLKGILGEAAARSRQDRHLPRRTVPAAGQAPRQAQGPRRRRPLHPGHHLAPARRPHRPLPRPRQRLLRQPHRQSNAKSAATSASSSPGCTVTITQAA